MSVGFLLLGNTQAADVLAAVERAARAFAGDPDAVTRDTRDDGRPVLRVALHPAAEDVELTDLGRGRLEARATTSTCGPGYHAHACALLDTITEAAEITWDPPSEEASDETGYFHDRDPARLFEAFDTWLAATLARVRDAALRGATGIGLSMPVSHEFLVGGRLLTQLGPRDDAWLGRALDDPRRARDVFPWWEPGDGADGPLGRALVRMWLHVRWRRPLDDAEKALLESIARDLEEAFRRDPTRDFPFAEWREVLELCGRGQTLIATRVGLRAETAPPHAELGYRRGPVRARLGGGWSIELPGALAEAWDERGTFSAQDATRTLWITTVSVQDGAHTTARETLEGLGELGDGLRFDWQDGPLIGCAVSNPVEQAGAKFEEVRAHCAIANEAAIVTMCVAKEEDRDLAIETIRTLHNERAAD